MNALVPPLTADDGRPRRPILRQLAICVPALARVAVEHAAFVALAAAVTLEYALAQETNPLTTLPTIVAPTSGGAINSNYIEYIKYTGKDILLILGGGVLTGAFVLVAAVFWLPVATLLCAAFLGHALSGVGASGILIVGSVWLGSGLFLRIKRGRPDGYDQQVVRLWLDRQGLMGAGFAVLDGKLGTQRCLMP